MDSRPHGAIALGAMEWAVFHHQFPFNSYAADSVWGTGHELGAVYEDKPIHTLWKPIALSCSTLNIRWRQERA
jgi:hypothetical protein